ncbi:hemicentin-1 [Sitophilus oryzae]|uniref:Hemicentin-1 n=1 Tax=Sitophilus oryzae TaxID=7048 RepID=A0A6J2X1Q5_SITOR|nr:hemicentin-1 [Sitophilus oryzae]
MAVESVVVGVILLVIGFGGLFTLDSKEFQKSLPAKVVWAVPGHDAELPCDVTPALPGDNVNMIFWFKDTIGMPLYSLDARGGPLSKASHLAISDDIGRRSYFIADEEPSKARLRIQSVNAADEGVFRCRVDFVNSPTRNFQVNLTLIDQPSTPRIFDAEGREVKPSASAGPFLEGRELFLSCQVEGGHPPPSLTWWHNNTVLDEVVDSNRGAHTTVNQLLIKSVSRNLRGGRLECRASSSEIAGNVVREVPITVFLKPNKVKIVTPNDLLSSGKSKNVRCETSGSAPPAKLTWFLDGRPIRNAVVTEEETSSFTGSILTLTVSAEDDDKLLVCRADNPRFPGGSAQDSRRISVAYPPRVSVVLDSDVAATPVRQGTDVILRCKAQARPQPHSYYWYHDNHLVAYNETGGVLPHLDLLTIKNIDQKSAGQYACSARNSEGESYSAPFDLIVQYAPHCKKGHEDIHLGMVPYEPIIAQCIVDSIPPVNKFFWTYNTSRDVLPIQGAHLQNKGNVSILHFLPPTNDVNGLACYAENDVGRQAVPCFFRAVPAELPESPRSCSVRNSTQGFLEVSCLAGNDGGLRQNFVLEVSDVSGPAPPGIHSTLNDQGEEATPFRFFGERPVFKLLNLQPNREYQAIVYAENARGRSNPPVILPVIRRTYDGSMESLQEDGNGPLYDSMDTSGLGKPHRPVSNQNLTIIIAGISVTAVLLIVIVVVVSTVIACKKSRVRNTTIRRRERRSSKPPSELELSEAGFGEGFHRRSAMYRASMYGDCEERISRLIEGPDLILSPASFSPHNSDY